MKYESYRQNLAADLRDARKEGGGREKAKLILEQEKQTIRYTEARDLHLESDVLPKFEDVVQNDDEAVKRLGEKTLYEQKVSLLSEVFMEQFEEAIGARMSAILTKVGFRNAEGVTMWESAKGQLLDAVQIDSAGIANRSLYQDSMAGIRLIDRGSSNSSVEKFVSDHLEALGTEEIEKLQQWLKDRATSGEYQLYGHMSSDMLEDVMRANKLLSEHIEGYDPTSFGITKALRDRLIVGIACVRADFKSKPNYRYARPEFNGMVSSIHNLLVYLADITAQEVLKTHDVELPKK